MRKHSSKKSINLPFNQLYILKNTQTSLSFSKYKLKNENPVQFELPLKGKNSGSVIQPIDQALLLKVGDSISQTQPVSSNFAVDQSHFLDVSSSNSKPDIKAANRVLPEALIKPKNEEVLTSNNVSNKISFPSFVKVNSDVPTLETKEQTCKYDIANFRYRGSNLSDIQRKEIM